jgi:hypothetical protein
LPILTHSTPFEEWKEERNIPNGIPKQFYLTKFQSSEKILNYTLVEYVKINKFLIVPEACDYTNPDIANPKFPIHIINESDDSNNW